MINWDFDPEATYFFWVFDPRFDPLLDEYQRYRESLYPERQVPIIVRSFECLKKPPGPMIVMGRGTADEIYQEEPEDLNFALSGYLRNSDEFRLLVERQGSIDVVSFTNERLSPLPQLNIFGAAPAVADRLNSKTYQHALFQREGVRQPRAVSLSSFREVRAHYTTIHSDLGHFLLRPAYSAGGWKSSLITSPEELESYRTRIPPSDLEGPFLASEFIETVSAPAAWGIVTRGGAVMPLGVCDQILNGFRFMGDIYPSFLPSGTQRELLAITQTIGDAIASEGYRGFYGVDFITGKDGGIFTTELNARFTFGVLILVESISGNLFTAMESDAAHSVSRMNGLLPLPTERTLLFKLPTRNPQAPIEDAGTDLNPICVGNSGSTAPLTSRAEAYWPERITTIRCGSYRGLATARFSLSTDYPAVLSHFQMECNRS